MKNISQNVTKDSYKIIIILCGMVLFFTFPFFVEIELENPAKIDIPILTFWLRTGIYFIGVAFLSFILFAISLLITLLFVGICNFVFLKTNTSS